MKIVIEGINITPNPAETRTKVTINVSLLRLQPHKGLHPHKGLQPVNNPYRLIPERGLYPHKGLVPSAGRPH
ncbi:MAG: hypothetical protein ACOX8K_13730 [Lachnospiraceae bacterium]|jgi:hypothetical protein